jgi:hypothetical protein
MSDAGATTTTTIAADDVSFAEIKAKLDAGQDAYIAAFDAVEVARVARATCHKALREADLGLKQAKAKFAQAEVAMAELAKLYAAYHADRLAATIRGLELRYVRAVSAYADAKGCLEYARVTNAGGDSQALREAELQFEVAWETLINTGSMYHGQVFREAEVDFATNAAGAR